MRRFIVFALVTALALGLSLSAAVRISGTEDGVELRSKVYVGDKSAAEGLRLTVNAIDDERWLAWRTSFTIAGGEERDTRTEFDFSLSRSPSDSYDGYYSLYKGQVDMSAWSGEYSVSGWFSMESIVENFGEYYNTNSMSAYIKGVAARTTSGETRRETVRVADFYKRIPWSMSEGNSVLNSTKPSERQGNELMDLFTVETPSDMYALVTVSKDPQGNFSRVSSFLTPDCLETQTKPYAGYSNYGTEEAETAPERYILDVYACGDSGEAGVWVYPAAIDRNGENILEYRDGQGLYFIPRVTNPEQVPEAERSKVWQGDIYVKNAALLYPTGGLPLYVRLDEGEKRVLLYTLEEGMMRLTVLDSLTGEVLDGQDVLPLESRSIYTISRDDLYFVLSDTGDAALMVKKDGEWRRAFTTHIDMNEEYGELGSFQSAFMSNTEGLGAASDGERLAVAASSRAVAVLDGSGIVYLARYNISPIWDGVPESDLDWSDRTYPRWSHIETNRYLQIPFEASFLT